MAVFENITSFCSGQSDVPQCLELECSYSPGTHLLQIHSQILNMNKIQPTSQWACKAYILYSYSQADRWISKNHFFIFRGRLKIYRSVGISMSVFFHITVLSYIYYIEYWAKFVISRLLQESNCIFKYDFLIN